MSFHHPDPAAICPSFGRGSFDGSPAFAPLVQATTFVRDGVGSEPPHQYSRVSNPTVSALEEALGRLEEALPAVTFGTGLAAETALFLSLLRAGDHVVLGRSIYGGTTRLVRQILSGLGIRGTFVDATDAEAVRAALEPETRLVFLETPANPTLELTDIAAIAAIAKEAGALVAVDNTFLTPILQRPLDLGADVTVTSTTKFVEGHSLALGGSLVTRDPDLAERFRFIRKSTGGIQAPLDAWLTLNGLRTLAVRLERQSETARNLAFWLAEQSGVARVHHPALGDGPTRELARRQHLGADGAVLSFELDADVAATRSFVRDLELAALVEHVGGIDTLVTHPASMTHADTPREQRLAAGLADGLLRLSVGLEPFDAIRDDLAQALGGLTARESSTPGDRLREVVS